MNIKNCFSQTKQKILYYYNYYYTIIIIVIALIIFHKLQNSQQSVHGHPEGAQQAGHSDEGEPPREILPRGEDGGGGPEAHPTPHHAGAPAPRLAAMPA